jgi:putative CocE/NonD family hydrolase
MFRFARPLIAALALAFSFSPVASSQAWASGLSAVLLQPVTSQAGQAEIKSYPSRGGYTKYEYMIPMRDGVRLYVNAYVPDQPGKHPILMQRTPYGSGPYGAPYRNFSPNSPYTKAGYIIANADVRGKFMSEGDFVDIRPQLTANHGATEIDESTDTYDTVDFLVKNVPYNNGAVGLRGISYPGFYAEIGTVHTHPALKAASPQAPVSEWFLGDDWHHNGVLFQQDGFDFMTFFGPVRNGPYTQPPSIQVDRPAMSAYDFFLSTGAMPNFDAKYYKGRIPYWNEVLSHETYDSWWQARSVPGKLRDIHCALLFVGGWFDAEDCYGALHSFQASRKANKIPDFLVMGPWFHGMWSRPNGKSFGLLDYGQDTTGWYQQNVEFPFFEKYLRGQSVPDPSLATVFETGDNQWRKFETWPPAEAKAKTLYLTGNKGLSFSRDAQQGTDSYENDPAHPTPYTEDLSLTRRPSEYMIADQRFAEKRADVLTYTGPVLDEDVTVAGPVDVDLLASTTGTDADFVVKLIDVYPSDTTDKAPDGSTMAGSEIMIRGDVMRGKFRESFSNPTPFLPGKLAKVHFEMNDILHKFRKGHRLMVQIQSNWFPLTNRNPNVFTNINTATDSAYQKATISIAHGGANGSAIHFKVLNP